MWKAYVVCAGGGGGKIWDVLENRVKHWMCEVQDNITVARWLNACLGLETYGKVLYMRVEG